MNVLFEEDGAFKAGSILADNNTSLQIELPTGKRSKVKSSNVLLRFASPNAAELMQRAEVAAEEIDISFLWEVCGDNEFAFEELAAEYQGDKPGPVDAAAVLMRLHSAPMYFHRKGKGRYRKAPPEILQAALNGLEKKRLQSEQVERMTQELVAGTLPAEFPPLLQQLLYKPDRNRLETKAFEAACAETHLSAPKLLARVGGIANSHDYQLGRFLFEYFPKGTDFPSHALELPSLDDLPLSDAKAFSIDDAQTTEIDDALSVTPRPQSKGGGWRVGIHIAAPGLAVTPETALGTIARERLSTVYMPGRKITMLPDAVVDAFTLAEGKVCPALSLYLDIASDLRIEGSESRLERIHVAANLRHHDIEPVFNDETLSSGDKNALADFPYRDELFLLWQLATVMEAGRGKPSANRTQKDYNFRVDWDRDGIDPGFENTKGWISLDERQRGSPLDMLVAEMMIAANAGWGAALRDAGIAAIYRAQTAGKVRMTTVAAPHEGLGVDCYAWSSSPLRRYVDLINQWQLIAWLRQETPRYTAKDATLLAALRDFELTYAAYAEFQRGMERYWCLRLLMQSKAENVIATVLREQLVRLEDMPLVLRVASVPLLNRGARVTIDIDRIDLLDADIHANWRSTLAEQGEVEENEDEAALIGAEEITEAPAPAPELAGDTGSANALEAPADAG
ncbi:MAG TPA: RNB domain-containing ribonuclease [Rhodocyclaceae bacterium]|nr:RNB domain-containing ribonuclease [Rhodocyclaceae bacterium]